MTTIRGIFAVALAGVVGHAQAAAQPDKSEISTVRVTAQRVEKSLLETPASVTAITAEQIESSSAGTVYGLLDSQLGVSNMSYGPEGREYGLTSGRLIVRGLDKGTLVMLNGAPMNLLNYNGSENIPLESIERVELIRGASSTLYGSEALGGVVNVITRRASGEPRSRLNLTEGNYQKRWALGHENDKVGLYFSKSYYDAVDDTSRVFPTSTTYWRLEDGRKDNAFATANLTDDLTLNWTYSHLLSTRERLKVNKGTTSTSYQYDDTRHGANLVYNNSEYALKSVLFYNSRDLDSESGALGKARTPSASETFRLYNAGIDTQKAWTLRGDRDTLVTGIGLAKEDFKGRITGYHADRSSTALYASYDWRTTDRLTTTLGTRAQFIDDYAKDQNVVVSQLQTLYALADHWSWYINVGQSFQMPPLNQYFSRADGGFEDLKPQKGWTYETGLKYIDGNNLWSVAVYHMDIEDKFYWAKTPDGRDILINRGDFRNTGIEMEYRRSLGDYWQFNVGGSYSNPEVNDSGKWVQDSNKVQLLAGVQFKRERWLASVNYMHIGEREYSYYQPGERTPNRDDLNAMVKFQANKDNAFTVNLRNILDRDNPLNKYENWDMPFTWTLSWDHTF